MHKDTAYSELLARRKAVAQSPGSCQFHSAQPPNTHRERGPARLEREGQAEFRGELLAMPVNASGSLLILHIDLQTRREFSCRCGGPKGYGEPCHNPPGFVVGLHHGRSR